MRKVILFYFLCVPIYIFGQHQDVFPGLSGEQLTDSIRARYTSTTLGYSSARDTLFRNILAVDNQMECLYSGWVITLHPDQDPTKDAFSQNVNTEHIYPQSKGAKEEPAVSNMYILYPELDYLNSSRGTIPFGDVKDSETQVWYYQKQKRHSIPPSDSIDLFTELGAQRFEPRESVKGDVARSVFYFYTIYRSECQRLDSTFFPTMAHDLCLWHYADPVSQNEWNKNALIKLYQGGKDNPFILDCTLPERSYCSESGLKCTPGQVREAHTLSEINIYPNPVLDQVNVHSTVNIDRLVILDSRGAKVRDINIKSDQPDTKILTDDWSHGAYFIAGFSKGFIVCMGKFIVN
jgi:endonuclease I